MFLARSTVGNGLPRAFCACGILVFGTVSFSINAAETDQAREHEFNVPRQNVDAALNELATQADALLLFPYDLVQPVDSNPVIGKYTVRNALGILLRDTGLTGGLTEGGVITISRAVATESQGGTTMLSQNENKSTTKHSGLLGVLAAVFSVGAGAQEEVNTDEEEKKLEEIVVTGTHIRGIAPDSTPTLSFDQEDIKATGLPTLNQFLRTIPQNFGGGNQEENRSNNANGGAVRGGASVNLRGFGPGRTLSLLNGRRLSAEQGSFGPFVDISMIPIAAVERVEVVTAGASSVYGSDAIGGVINFILRDDFEGAETSVSLGTLTDGDGTTFNASQSLGTSWNSGNAFIVYDYFSKNSLLAGDRDFTDPLIADTELTANIDARHSVLTTIRQDIGDSVEFFGDTYFSSSKITRDVNAAFRDAFNEEVTDRTSYGGTVGFRYDISESWQAEVYTTHSRSDSTLIVTNVDTGFVQAGSPGDLESTSTIIGVKTDGRLFSLLGGDVKIAIGSEERYEQNTSTTPARDRTLKSDVFAAFGELFVPLVGKGNTRPGLERLEITASARYESFDGDLDSTDPQVGLLWAPTTDLRFRGNWGTSFRTPTLGQRNPLPVTAFLFSFFTIPNPVSATPVTLFLQGTDPDLGRETSEFWTVGFDYSPQFIRGLNINLTYFNIDLTDEIGIPPLSFDLGSPIATDFVTLQPTQQQILDALVAGSGTTPAELDALLTAQGLVFSDIEAIYTLGFTNIAQRITRGFDITIDYRFDTNVGELGINLNSSYITEYDITPFGGAPVVSILNTLNQPVDWRLNGGLSWSRGGTNANLVARYVDDYVNENETPSAKIASFLTVDLNISHNFGESTSGVLRGARIGFAVQNLFDRDPPFVGDGGIGSFVGEKGYDGANASALGRYVGLTVSKNW